MRFYVFFLKWSKYYRVFSHTWPASMQIYWNKRKCSHKKRVQLLGDWFGTPTWPPFHCFGTPIWPPWRHVKTLYNPGFQRLFMGGFRGFGKVFWPLAWLRPMADTEASSRTREKKKPWPRVTYMYLLYRHECLTGKYTTRKIHENYIRDPSCLFSIISHVSLSMT